MPHVRLQLKSVGDLGVTGKHLPDADDLQNAALTDSETPHLFQMKARTHPPERSARVHSGEGILRFRGNWSATNTQFREIFQVSHLPTPSEA